ncbi:S8 family serine peptidase [Actinoplanes sp. NPDC051861]|uniref:S8 family serine peptidase n=1 Tax=Actinoplanes sp. NPDC051861 TaxID=3155170 RepID=UPI003443173D
MKQHRGRWAVALALGAVAVIAAPAEAADTKVAAEVSSAVRDGGKTTFWVLLRDTLDLTGGRAAEVHDRARASAARSQKVLRTLLTSRKATFESYWIADTMRVTGDAALVEAVASRPEVKAVLPDKPVTLPAPAAGRVQAAVDAVEWNIDRIGAPRVWADRDDRGQGIVVANVDTGVQFDHPVLAAGYRGRQADGSYQHDYNWYDPSRVCPDAAPCDNNGHGTHTMGTIAGSEGVGVAPGATWIAAKGCETSSCSVSALLAAGQWIVAPTDRNGQNPRPDLAPDVVNNSWGGAPGFDPWYADVVRAWVAAGIFPAFSNGNAGPSCGTAATPGSYADTYSSGAFDIGNAIAGFSSRGSGQNGTVKPDLAAPGADVRSSTPGNGYASLSGTSMASPHTAGTVALIWAAAPALRRDVAATREILDATAIDTDDTSCGGTAGDNNVFGEGRLDAYAAVALAVRPAGSLTGTVTGAGVPLAGATVALTGAGDRTTATGADGGYRFGRLPAGVHHLRVSAFGYDTYETDLRIVEGVAQSRDADLAVSASATIEGLVSAAGAAVPGASVSLAGTPVSVRTGDDGRYRIAAPLGAHRITVSPLGGCTGGASRDITLTGDVTVDLPLDQSTDRYGHVCGPSPEPYRAGSERLALTGDDNAIEVSLPFPVPHYGVAHERAWISTNGLISFDGAQTRYANTGLPDVTEPNNAIYPFWDDLFVGTDSGVYIASDGDTFVVEWRDVRFFGEDTAQRLSVSAVLRRDGSVTFGYRGLAGARAAGISATVGLEGPAGGDGFAYAVNGTSVTEGLGVRFRTASRRVAATFNVTGETYWGQNVFVTGNIGELGEWDPARAVALSAAGYPVWSGEVSLPAGTAIEFKYLKKNPDGSVTWEQGENRSTVTPPGGQYVTHDEFRS